VWVEWVLALKALGASCPADSGAAEPPQAGVFREGGSKDARRVSRFMQDVAGLAAVLSTPSKP